MSKMIYKSGKQETFWGVLCDFKVVSEEDAAKLLQGNTWYAHPFEVREAKKQKAAAKEATKVAKPAQPQQELIGVDKD